MIRKTMRIGEVRTSIKLEPEFWGYLKEVADSRTIRLSRLVNEVASATPDRTNLASTLRTFCLIHAQLRWQDLNRELERLTLAGNTQDLSRVLDACPLPCLLLAEDRSVRRLNQAFAAWLHVDGRGVLGHRLDNLMILRGAGMQQLWARVFARGRQQGPLQRDLRLARQGAHRPGDGDRAVAGERPEPAARLPDHLRDPRRPRLSGEPRGARSSAGWKLRLLHGRRRTGPCRRAPKPSSSRPGAARTTARRRLGGDNLRCPNAGISQHGRA